MGDKANLKTYLLISIIGIQAAVAAQPPAAILCNVNANVGYELFSWKSQDAYLFVLRPGITPGQPLTDRSSFRNFEVEQLKRRIAQMQKNEPVCWRVDLNNGYVLPQTSILKQIRSSVSAAGIDLAIQK